MIKTIHLEINLRQNFWCRKITDSLSASAKLDYSSQKEVDGSDSRLNMRRAMMGGSMDSPTFAPTSQESRHHYFWSWFELLFSKWWLKRTSPGSRVETPIAQKVNGVQLEIDSVWTLVGNMPGNQELLNS